jgi:hypothetical protein
MRLRFCAACGEREDLRHHDLITGEESPQSDQTSVITLCFGCHLKFHGRPFQKEEVA